MVAAVGHEPAVALAPPIWKASSLRDRGTHESHPQRPAADAAAPASHPIPLLDLSCLDGLRAIACIAVIVFHCWLGVWTPMLPFEVASTLTRRHWLVRLASVGGPLGVEFFLVLTAMLATYQLLPLLEGRNSSSGHSKSNASSPASAPSSCADVTGYWRRRAVRLLPAYTAANLLMLCALGPTEGLSDVAALARDFAFPRTNCPAGLLRNLAFITNINVTQGCGIHLWSLALQVQFFMAIPLLLCLLRPRAPAFRARLAVVLAATFAAGTAWRLWLALTSPALVLPVGDHVRDAAGQAAYGALLMASYIPSGTRVAQLALGAALGFLLRSTAAVGWLLRRRTLVSATVLGLQAAFVHTQLAWHSHGVPGEPLWSARASRLYTALLYWGSPFTAALTAATLLALILHADPLHTALAAALRSPVFKPISKLSYCLYLIHEQARLWAILHLVPSGFLPELIAAAPVHGLVILSLITLAAAFPAAYLLHTLVEKRF